MRSAGSVGSVGSVRSVGPDGSALPDGPSDRGPWPRCAGQADHCVSFAQARARPSARATQGSLAAL